MSSNRTPQLPSTAATADATASAAGTSTGMGTPDDIGETLDYLVQGAANDDEVAKRLVLAFLSACSMGDLVKAQYLLQRRSKWVTVNSRDTAGTTGLIAASCFGHLHVVSTLIELGADKDLQDEHGWTALMWATNNNHETVVEYLIDAGADVDTQSASGKTVRQFIEHAHLPMQDKLSSIFYNDARSQYTRSASSGDESFDDGASVGGATTLTTMTSMTSMTNDSYYVPSLYGVDYREMCDIVGTTIPAALQGITKAEKSPIVVDPEVYLLEEDEALIDFSYDTCQPDQMLVFSEVTLQRLLNVVMCRLSDPQLIRSHNNNPAGFTRRPISANVLFLAARYAGYYASQDLLDKLLSGALNILDTLFELHRNDMMVLGYWLSNCSRLLYYLKKDTGLVVTTLQHQVRLNEFIQDMFTELMRDAQVRLAAILDEAIMDHDTIPGFNTIKFKERPRRRNKITSPDLGTMRVKLSSYFGNGSGNSNNGHGSIGNASMSRRKNRQPRTPKTVTTILSSTLYVLQTFHIHPSLVHQALEQLFYYIGAATFNRLLGRPELCCRWKAMQIRMNISHIEEWVRSNHIPAPAKDTFTKHLQPVISLLQMLQVITHFKDLSGFLEALVETDHMKILNWSQVRRAVDIYTYELEEPKVSDDIYGYIIECAEQQQSLASVRDIENDDGFYNERRRPSVISIGSPTSPRPDQDAAAAVAAAAKSPTSPRVDGMPVLNDVYDPIEEQTDLSSSPPLNPTVRGPVVSVTATATRSYLCTPPPEDGRSVSSPDLSHSPADSSSGTIGRRSRLKVSTTRSSSDSPSPSPSPSGMPSPAIGSDSNVKDKDLTTYSYHLYDAKYWLPFAIPSNVGERIAMRIVDGEERYLEEVPVISEDVVDMLDAVTR
ncbi:Histone-lysine N-methyltransferase [Sorochytrium milnesiophthora]